jgi:hypothetical protein
MSSYVDANQAFRRASYHTRRPPRRQAVRIKAGRVLIVLAILWLALIRVAYGGGRTGTEQITVQPGQTLWSIAAARYPDDDPRARVGEIVDLNHLSGGSIYPGEALQVPAR